MSWLTSLLPSTGRTAPGETAQNANGNGLRSWAPILGGGALFLYGIKRRSLGGAILASAGGVLLYRGVTPRPTTMRTGAAITINKRPEELYRFWKELEHLPRIMNNILAVRKLDERRSRWTAKSVAGMPVEWVAEIVHEEPDRSIAWRSDQEAEIFTRGEIRFQPAPGDRGTEVNLDLEYSTPLGIVGAADAAAMGYEPSQQAREDLRRFKQFMETGEIATTQGQPAGERGRAPAPEQTAGFINNLLEGANILRSGGRATRSRAGTRT